MILTVPMATADADSVAVAVAGAAGAKPMKSEEIVSRGHSGGR